jgi:hypothetical protein
LFCFCRRAAWSRLFDISFIPKSCAEKTGARVRNKNRSMEEPAEIGREERKKREGASMDWSVIRLEGNGPRACSPPGA